MNEIILAHYGQKVTADSRMIAEHFEKRHADVIRAIESLVDSTQNCVDLFYEAKYTDASGKSNKRYDLTRDGFSLLVMGFTGQKALEWKLKYIAAFNAMEKQISTVRIPQTFADALRLAADQAEILEKQKPLVAFAETCAKSESTVLIRELAKIASKGGIEIGEKRLFQRLRDWKMIFGRQNEPYQEYIDRGYFEVSQGVHENENGTFLHKTTRVLPKGQQYIIDRLRKEEAV